MADLDQQTESKCRHDEALEQCHACLPDDAAGDRIKAEAIDDRVAEHIDGVGKQGSRVGGKTCAELEKEHQTVQTQNDPKGAPLMGWQVRPDVAALVHRHDYAQPEVAVVYRAGIGPKIG